MTIYLAKTAQQESIPWKNRPNVHSAGLDRFPKRNHRSALHAQAGNMPVEVTVHVNPVQRALTLRDRLTVARSVLLALTPILERIRALHAFPDNDMTVRIFGPNAQTALHQLTPPIPPRNARNVRLDRTQATEQRSAPCVIRQKDMY